MITYNDEKHEYAKDGRVIPSVTQMLEKVFPALYSLDAVNKEILEGAKEFGTEVHRYIEVFLKTGERPIDDLMELEDFIYIWIDGGFSLIASEKLVYCDDLAGRVDIVAMKDGKRYIMDIKTTSARNKLKVQFQLSLYKYLYEKMTGEKIDEIAEVWLHSPCAEIISIPFRDEKWCESVIEAYYNGETLPVGSDMASIIGKNAVQKAEELYDKYVEAQKYLEDFRKTLLETMKKNGIIKASFRNFNASIREESTTKRFDTVRFKKEHPELAELYMKDVTVAPSVVLTMV